MELRILDLGSNSFQLQRLRIDDAGMTTLARAKRFFRLGERLDEGVRFSDRTIAEAVDAVGELLAEVPGDGPSAGVATAAARRASNGAVFVAEVEERHGIPCAILSGEQEAEYAFLGAWTALSRDLTRKIAVVDIGGGSTEIAVGSRSHITLQASLSLGALDLPLDDQGNARSADSVGQVERRIEEVLRDATLSVPEEVETVVFASGSARAVRDTAMGLLGRGPADLQRGSLSVHDLENVAARVVGMDAGQLVRAGCPEDRVGVVRQTAVLMHRVVEFCGGSAAVIVATGVREGVAIRFFERTRRWRAQGSREAPQTVPPAPAALAAR